MAGKGKYGDWLTADGLIRIQGWARDGLTEKQIAKNMRIGETTFQAWKKRFPEIVDALKKGKAPVDFEVENSLLKSALGYSVFVKKPVKVRSVSYNEKKQRIEEEKVIYADEEIYIPPSNTAQIFWLKNRRPDRWKDKPQPNNAAVVQDDGFLDALKSTAAEDWSEEEEDGNEE